MKAAKKSKRILVIFILVLILHLILIWLSIKIRTIINPSPPLDVPESADQELLHKKKPWVTLQSAPSNPVLFKTVPQTIAPDPATQPVEQDIIEPLQRPERQKKAPKKELITQQAPSAPFAQSIQEEPVLGPQTLEQENMQQEKKSAERTHDHQKEKPSKLTFSNIMQGFAHHLQQQQHANTTDEYTMRGKERGKATAEQLKHAQYGSKICAAINNAFLVNNHKNVLSLQKNYTLIMRIIINKDGSLCEAHILSGSDSPIVDRTIIAIINSASQSFPPIPHFFNMEQYPCVITINDALRAIEHPEQLRWTL